VPTSARLPLPLLGGAPPTSTSYVWRLFAVAPFTNAIRSGRTGILPREYTRGNDYQIDRDVQRTATFI